MSQELVNFDLHYFVSTTSSFFLQISMSVLVMCSMNAMSMPCVLTLLVAMTAPVLLGMEEMASIAQVHSKSVVASVNGIISTQTLCLNF